MTRVGVGIIGAGNISGQYLDNLTTFPDVEVLFIADIDAARAKEQADKYGVPGSGSTEELLAHSGIEIVVNLTIPAAHSEVALAALAAGKNVWTEKPFALDRATGRAVLAEAERLGLRACGAPDTFLGAGLQAGRRLIADGRIGTPLTALTLFQVGGPETWHPSPDFFYAVGGGPLFDMGPYYLTTLVQNFGPVKRVAATGSVARETRVIGSGPRAGETIPVEIPTHISALIEFESGASAQSVFSFQSALSRTGFVEIAGSEGTLVFNDPNNFDGDLTLWADGATDAETIPTTKVAGRGTGVLDLARSIRAGVPERASGALAFHVLDIMVSISEAVDTGAFVDVTSTVEPSAPLPGDWDPFEATL